MIAADERCWLQTVNQPVRPVEMPVGFRFVPHAVEPDAGDIAIAGEQLPKLAVHEIQIAVKVASLRAAGCLTRVTARIVIRVVPVELRMIEEQLDPLAVALV